MDRSSERQASAANYMVSIESLCKMLDIKFSEIPDWNCCGASIGCAEGGELPRHSMNACNIALSEQHNPKQDIVATCAACRARHQGNPVGFTGRWWYFVDMVRTACPQHGHRRLRRSRPEGSRFRLSSPHFAMALLAVSVLTTPLPALAAERSAIPHINDRARQGYQQYRQAEMHRAYAIAPGGSWAWKYGFDTREEAVAAATAACQQGTEQTCVPYAINDDVVFNARRWPTLWRPYKTAAEAAQAPEGQHRGERFPDLLFKNASGKPVALSSLRGKVVLLHLWGTWCPTCVHEIPQFQELVNAMRDVSDLVFVFSPVREPYADARRWLEQRGIRLPLYDSGSHSPQHTRLQLAAGGTLADRAVAPVFPVTYVLDRHGIVVFSYRGSPSDWLEYTSFLRDVATHSK